MRKVSKRAKLNDPQAASQIKTAPWLTDTIPDLKVVSQRLERLICDVDITEA